MGATLKSKVPCIEAGSSVDRNILVLNCMGRESNPWVMEGIQMCEEITGKEMETSYTQTNPMKDHIWYIRDLSKFKSHYPEWKLSYPSVRDIFQEIYDFNQFRWGS